VEYHESFTDVTFVAQYPTMLWGTRYDKHDIVTVELIRPWDEEEGLGKGGPWGWGGYTNALVASLCGTSAEEDTCPKCLSTMGPLTYQRGDPQPPELPDTDMDQALHGRDSMRYCGNCGFDLDSECWTTE